MNFDTMSSSFIDSKPVAKVVAMDAIVVISVQFLKIQKNIQ